jgi:peptidyl-dipeptidase A
MESGASRNWREVLMEATGNDMNANSMLDYFEPLLIWLKEQNKGRKYTLPEDL